MDLLHPSSPREDCNCGDKETPAGRNQQGQKGIWNQRKFPNLLILVAGPQHGGEGRDLLLATTLFTRLFEIALGTDITDDAFAVETLLQTAQRALNGLTFTDFDFYRHDLKMGKKKKPTPSRDSVN
jgi:hypothetical protein